MIVTLNVPTLCPSCEEEGQDPWKAGCVGWVVVAALPYVPFVWRNGDRGTWSGVQAQVRECRRMNMNARIRAKTGLSLILGDGVYHHVLFFFPVLPLCPRPDGTSCNVCRTAGGLP